MLFKSSTLLRNKNDAISDLAHQESEPIYITKNDVGDIMGTSIEASERREELNRLKAKLAAAEDIRASGHIGVSLEESRARLAKICILSQQQSITRKIRKEWKSCVKRLKRQEMRLVNRHIWSASEI